MRTPTGGQLVSIKAWLQQAFHTDVRRGVLLEPALRLGRVRGYMSATARTSKARKETVGRPSGAGGLPRCANRDATTK
ncbi:hypothetical protein AB0E63_39925 [Kribbella sp. NPDC026596]|uniref:hypothetical protein n=1 Tax=Kribbella sp. NPDC026596 TaxID=3155122 RepID=UPI0033F26ABE